MGLTVVLYQISAIEMFISMWNYWSHPESPELEPGRGTLELTRITLEFESELTVTNSDSDSVHQGAG